MKLVRQDRCFHQFLPHGSHILLLSNHFFVSSTFTDKNNPWFRWTKRQSQFGSFLHPSSNRISSNCFSHNNPANGCPYKFRSKSTIFNDCPGIRSFVSWKTYPYVWTFWLRNCEQPRSVLRFYLSVGRCCISCLSVTIWQSCNNIHYFCGSHLDGRSAMFCKNCGGSRVVYYNVITEHDSAFEYFWFWFKLRVLEVTYVHQCGKVDFLFVSLCLDNNLFLTLDFFQFPCWNRFEFFPFLPLSVRESARRTKSEKCARLRMVSGFKWNWRYWDFVDMTFPYKSPCTS